MRWQGRSGGLRRLGSEGGAFGGDAAMAKACHELCGAQFRLHRGSESISADFLSSLISGRRSPIGYLHASSDC